MWRRNIITICYILCGMLITDAYYSALARDWLMILIDVIMALILLSCGDFLRDAKDLD